MVLDLRVRGPEEELEQVEALEFIFTAPTFVPTRRPTTAEKERREFFIPKAEREASFTARSSRSS